MDGKVDDVAAWRCRASKSQKVRAIGGSLSMTRTTLIFVPHWFDAHWGEREWRCDLSEILTVRVVPPTGRALLAGGLRRRLEVRCRNGESALFVVSDVERAERTILARLAA